jgi:chromosome segregation ATPase
MEKTTIHHRKEKIIETNSQDQLAHFQTRIDELVRENEELRQKTQVVVKKIETNIVEKRPGLDEEAAQKITELENRLSQAELLSSQKVKEVEELNFRMVKFNDLQADLDVLTNRNGHLEQQLNEKCLELEAFKVKFNDLNDLYLRDKEIIQVKERDLIELYKRLEDLETLPNQIAAAKKNSELLIAEVDRLTILAKERDHELQNLRDKLKTLEAQICVEPREHDELRARIKYIETLTAELDDLKAKYNSLCIEYDKEIKVVRSKDKEISSVNKELQATIKESRKALDKELSHEEKLEHQVEKLTIKLQEKDHEIDEWKKRAACIPALEKKVKHLEDDFIKLDDKYRKLEEINRQLQLKVDALNTELASYRDALKQKEKAFEYLEKEKLALIAEFEKSQREASAMLTKVNDQKNAEIQDLKDRLAVLSNQMCATQKELETLRAEYDRLKAEERGIVKTLQEHTAQEKELFARVEELKKQKEYLSKEISDLVAEKDSFKATAITKDKEAHQLDKSVHALEKEIARLNGVIADLQKSLESATFVVSERDSEIRGLKDQLQNVTHAYNELFKERETLVLENASLVNRVMELETSVTVITKKYDKLDSIYNQIKGATEHLGEVQETLEHAVEETEHVSNSTQVVNQKTKVKQEFHENRF